MANNPVLEVARLSAGYGGSAVLQDVALKVAPGEIVAVLGRNGMGKTTLLRSIMGLVPATGDVWFQGDSLTHLPSHGRAQLGIGYVPQGRGLFAGMTVAENVATGRAISTRRISRTEKSLLQTLHDAFPILVARGQQIVGTMSGGEQQQVALARALISDPDLLLLDEPSEGIQPSIVKRLAAFIKKLQSESQRAVLLVEQNIELICMIADRFYVIENGRVVHGEAVDPEKPDELHKYIAL